MKLKKALCITALSAAVAFSGLPLSGTAPVVQAEEAQMAALDDILRQMYLLYQQNAQYEAACVLDRSLDWIWTPEDVGLSPEAMDAMHNMQALDASDTTQAYAGLIRNSGADRYVLDLDGDTKLMMYVTPDSYWWYFGPMENGLRHGNGTTIVLGSDLYEKFTGNYNADLPDGQGVYTIKWNNGTEHDIAGDFRGVQLNGRYQVDSFWYPEGMLNTSSLSITYADSRLVSVDGWDYEHYREGDDDIHNFYSTAYDSLISFTVDPQYRLASVALTSDGTGRWWGKTDVPEHFSSLFLGNSTAAAYTPSGAPAPVVPETPAPAPETPQQPAATGTYTVARGDNLSKIADKVYGDSTLWRKIYNANKNVIKSGYILYAGQTLTIPQV